jgi:carotenoid cleavage dioxygenase-like enzyme
MSTSYFPLGFEKPTLEISIASLPVRGKLPEWLNGTLIRNGPGTFQAGQQRYRHWFDGLAMLHRFTMRGGAVAYANKFLQTKAYRAAQETGRITYSEFATDPCRTLFDRVNSYFDPTDTRITDSAKVSVALMAGKYLALAETPIQIEFDPETLATVGVFTYEDNLTGQMTTVHPHFDFDRRTAYNLVTRFHARSHYNVYQIAQHKQKILLASLPVSQPAYLHSFGMSARYFILAEFPLVVNPLDLLLWRRPYIENYRWQPGRGTRFWVVERATGQLRGRYEAAAFFAFHHVNAFEQGDDLFVDIVAYPDAGILQAYYLDRLQDGSQPLPHGNLRRYHIPLNGKTADYETLSDACMELPNFDYPAYNTRGDYRYVYAASLRPDKPEGFYNQIVKVDTYARHAAAWFADDCYPGEAIFVPRPGAALKDDGVLLSVVLDARRGISFLLVLDAHTLDELARAELPQPVLFGYHGAYFDL